MQIRDYQIQISEKASLILRELNIVYLALAVRVGKTLTALETVKLYGSDNILFVTKIKAFDSIQKDYDSQNYTFKITIINKESIHKVDPKQFDLIVLDEAHGYATYPKPNNAAKYIKQHFGHLPIIMLSGTPHPESYSQIFHQFWVSKFSPFKETNFYKWANTYVTKGIIYTSYGQAIDYSNANMELIKPIINEYMITFTQQQAGFETSVNENILYVKMLPQTYEIAARLIKDRVIEGKYEVILGDTGVKLMSKLHQLYSGTVKFESGTSSVIDFSKTIFIMEKFKGIKIAIFYKFKEELTALKTLYGNQLTEDLIEFNNTDKCIALQIISGREGISLSAAKYLVYYNIDFSAVSYQQSKDRLTTMDRKLNEVFWIFSEGGIEDKIYKAVMAKKKYTESIFKKDYKIINTKREICLK